MDRTLQDRAPALSVEATREWERHVQGVLRGVAHAINNRAAALAAAVELAREADATLAATAALLSMEQTRLMELAGVLRVLGVTRSELESFSPADAAAEATNIVRHHSDHRERDVRFDSTGAEPVRTYRWMFVRALVALAGSAAPQAAAPDAASIVISISANDGWVEVRAAGRPGAPSVYVAECAPLMGGENLPGGDGFRLPTLAALRKREGR